MWVPADQHPNVKPENYLELIQDTLQNIQISTNQDIDENKLELGNNHVISNRKRTGSVVRRPSRLKTSYTKFDDEPPLQTNHKKEKYKWISEYPHLTSKP